MRKLFLAALIAALPFAAQASQSMVHEASSGFYAGVGAGDTNLNLSSTAFGDAGSKDRGGFKITGGYAFNPFLAVEVAYYNPGTFKENDGGDRLRVTADIFQASALGTFPIVGRLEGFGRAGLSRWDGKLSVTSGGFSTQLRDSGTDFNWGLGLQSRLTDRFRLRVEFEQTSVDTNLGGVLPVTWRVRFTQVMAIYQF